MAPKSPVVSIPAAPPLISLLSSAQVINEPDSRWEAGIAFEPESCGLGNTGVIDPCVSGQKTLELGNGAVVETEVFGIYAGDSCSSFGSAARDFQGRARRKLASCESRLIEQEVWSGAQAQASSWSNRYLNDGNSDLVGEGLDPIDALACLEQNLAACLCGRGMIHATISTVNLWYAENLLIRITENGRTQLQTAMGTIVVPGSGYDGSGPAVTPGEADGPAAVDGAVWAYATSMVAIRQSPIVVVPESQAEALNRRINTLEYRAERLVAVAWDCCQLAVSINQSACVMGS